MKLPDQVQPFVEKLKNLDEKNRIYIFVGILLFLFLLDYFLLMSPQLATLSKLNPEIQQFQKDMTETKNNMARLPHFRGEVRRLNEEIDAEYDKLKSKFEVPLVLETISRLANEAGVKIDQISPQTINQEILLENDEKRFFILPIEIQARSGYHDFGKFINAIEKQKMYLDVATFVIASTNETRSHKIRLTLDAIIYEDL